MQIEKSWVSDSSAIISLVPGISILKTTNESKVVTNSLVSSAARPYWARNTVAVALTDTKRLRRNANCLNCATPYTDNEFIDMALIANGLQEGLETLLSTTCVTLSKHEREIVELTKSFNLPRHNTNNLSNKEKTRIFIKDLFEEYGAKVELQNFTVPGQKVFHIVLILHCFLFNINAANDYNPL